MSASGQDPDAAGNADAAAGGAIAVEPDIRHIDDAVQAEQAEAASSCDGQNDDTESVEDFPLEIVQARSMSCPSEIHAAKAATLAGEFRMQRSLTAPSRENEPDAQEGESEDDRPGDSVPLATGTATRPRNAKKKRQKVKRPQRNCTHAELAESPNGRGHEKSSKAKSRHKKTRLQEGNVVASAPKSCKFANEDEEDVGAQSSSRSDLTKISEPLTGIEGDDDDVPDDDTPQRRVTRRQTVTIQMRRLTVQGRRMTIKMQDQARELAGEFAGHFRGNLELEVVHNSPKIAVLWASCTEVNELPDILLSHNILVTSSMRLPRSDAFIFTTERPATWLKENQCGSAASEMESIRIGIQRALSSHITNEEVKYFMWPLHDAKFNRMLLAKVLTADGSTHHSVKKDNIFQELKVRIMVWLGLSFDRQAELTSAVQAHFGSDVALTFLFTLHYIFTLWYLALFGFIFHVLKNALDRSLYLAVFSPLFQFGILFPWSLGFVIKWSKRLQEASKTWMADLLEDEKDDYTEIFEICPEFKAWDKDTDPLYYPVWMRIVWTLPVVPLLALDILLMMIVLVGVFWAEMWIVFDWGKCSEINAANGNNECQGADTYRGFAGGLFEAVPGLVEGILFELLLAISKALARFAVWLQNWQTVTQKELAYIVQLVVFEFIGKFGWIALLAVVFVPDYESSAAERETFNIHSTGCSSESLQYFDSQLFGWFGLQDQSLTCLKTRTQYETRLALFEIAVAAPFFVSQIVSMCIKTLVPLLVVKLRKCFPNDHGRGAGCPCSVGRGLLRFLSCICLFDVEEVGINECNYLARGDLIGEEIFLQCCMLQGLPPLTTTVLDPRPRLLQVWSEGLREPFKSLDENLETVMHFFWVISFAAFFPLGVVLALTIYVFDVRTDLFRVTVVQRRNFRKPPQATLIMLQRCMTVAVAFASVFNVLVTFVTYKQFSRWSTQPTFHKDRGVSNYAGLLVAVIFGWSMFLLLIQYYVHRVQNTREHATNLEASRRSVRVRRRRHSHSCEVSQGAKRPSSSGGVMSKIMSIRKSLDLGETMSLKSSAAHPRVTRIYTGRSTARSSVHPSRRPSGNSMGGDRSEGVKSEGPGMERKHLSEPKKEERQRTREQKLAFVIGRHESPFPYDVSGPEYHV